MQESGLVSLANKEFFIDIIRFLRAKIQNFNDQFRAKLKDLVCYIQNIVERTFTGSAI